MKRRFIVWMIALWAGAALAMAAQAPQDLVRETADKIIKRVQAERAELEQEPARLYAMVDEMVLPHFDFERMSQWVLGKYWRGASPAQREQFIGEFRNLLVRTYAKSLFEYRDNRIDYLPLRAPAQATEVTVRTEVEQPGSFPVPIDYDLHLKNGAWKVFNVTVDGVSLVTNYRTTFSNQIRQDGLDKLIATLTERNQRDSIR